MRVEKMMPKEAKVSEKGAKMEQNGAQNPTKIRRPSVRRVRPRSRRDSGGGLPPPYPPALKCPPKRKGTN